MATSGNLDFGVIYDIPYRLGVLARVMGYEDTRTCRRQLTEWGVAVVTARKNQHWVSGRSVRLAIERLADDQGMEGFPNEQA